MNPTRYDMTMLTCILQKTLFFEQIVTRYINEGGWGTHNFTFKWITGSRNVIRRPSYIMFQDAHEFLGQVLDQLKEEMDKINKQIAVKSEATPEPTELNDKNPTASNFEFKITHTITCAE